MFSSALDVLCEAAVFVEENSGETPMDLDDEGDEISGDSGNESMALSLRPRNRMEKSKHTEIEKKRRAYLRDCMENLKAVVPLDRDINRFTIQRLLVKAQLHITTLERRCHDYLQQKAHCSQQQQQLKARLAELTRLNQPSPPPQAPAASALSLLSVAKKEEPPAHRVISRVVLTENNSGFSTKVLPGPKNRVTIQIQKIVPKLKKLSPTPPPIVTNFSGTELNIINNNSNTVPPLTNMHTEFEYSRNG